jgi:predicted porin
MTELCFFYKKSLRLSDFPTIILTAQFFFLQSFTREFSMNKKLIAVAVAAAFAAPMAASADATIYGAIDTGVQFTTVKGPGGKQQDNTTLESYDGALGIKGSEDLGNGMKAIYKVDWDFVGDDGNSASTAGENLAFTMDEVWVGLATEYGVVALGKEDHPYKNALNATGYNPFGDRVLDMDKGIGNSLGTLGFRQATADNAILYISPDFSGFSFTGAIVAAEGAGVSNAAGTSQDGFDAYSLGANYSGGGLKVGIGYEDIDTRIGVDDVSAWFIAGSYTFGDFKVGAAYEKQEDAALSTVPVATDTDEVETFGLSATYTMGKNQFGLMYTSEEQENFGGTKSAEIDYWGINFAHNLSSRTQVYASYAEAEDDLVTAGTAKEADAFAVGIVHSF